MAQWLRRTAAVAARSELCMLHYLHTIKQSSPMSRQSDVDSVQHTRTDVLQNVHTRGGAPVLKQAAGSTAPLAAVGSAARSERIIVPLWHFGQVGSLACKRVVTD